MIQFGEWVEKEFIVRKACGYHKWLDKDFVQGACIKRIEVFGISWSNFCSASILLECRGKYFQSIIVLLSTAPDREGVNDMSCVSIYRPPCENDISTPILLFHMNKPNTGISNEDACGRCEPDCKLLLIAFAILGLVYDLQEGGIYVVGEWERDGPLCFRPMDVAAAATFELGV